MIGVIVVAALALVALVWIAVPLLRGRRAEKAPPSPAVEEAEARKHAALTALVDIEEDLEIGKLSAADFDVLRAEYEREALRALKDLDSSTAGDSLEDEIAAMRRQMVCPNCGAIRVPGEACTRCDSPA
jgi:cytochrome c-type biogenesis protein CcmI